MSAEKSDDRATKGELQVMDGGPAERRETLQEIISRGLKPDVCVASECPGLKPERISGAKAKTKSRFPSEMTTRKQRPIRGFWLRQNDDGYGYSFSAACEARTYLRNKRRRH